MAVWSFIYSASAQGIFVCCIWHQRNPVLQDRLGNPLVFHTALPESMTVRFLGQDIYLFIYFDRDIGVA